ncbi:MAG: S-layer homology domain-containing protein [Oscillospiraceae bacterium]|nr:S-layer homology domain-containing protein [Oscillospiraceae bacterium]
MRKHLRASLSLFVLFALLLTLIPASAAGLQIVPFIEGSRDLATDNEWEALIQINTLRLEAGLEPLAMAEDLQPVAALRARELDRYFGSMRPDDRAWYTALDEAYIPYFLASELIARPFLSGQVVVERWAEDAEQLDALLGPYFTHIAISHNLGTDTWCALLVRSVAHESLSLHHSGGRYLVAGEPLSRLGLIIATYGEIGDAFIPLGDGMVTGLNTNRAGVQVGTFSLHGLSVDVPITVRFVDVNYNDWYGVYIDYVTAAGLFQGVSDQEFAPRSFMTRAMFVTVLGRQARRMELSITGDHSQFEDVGDDLWYTPYIGWAAERGITQGFGNFFGTGDRVTREQVATFLLRFFHYVEVELPISGPPCFEDRDTVSDWALEAVDLAVTLGLMSLTEYGQFRPGDRATRADVAMALAVFSQYYLTTLEPPDDCCPSECDPEDCDYGEYCPEEYCPEEYVN